MHTKVTLYINGIEIPIVPVEFEYGIASAEMNQIATISPPTSETGSKRGLTYIYRDLGEKYIDLTFNIRTDEKSWKYSSTRVQTDTDSTDEINPKYGSDISNPQEFINWMMYAHGSGQPLKITIEKNTQNSKGKNYTHTLTGTYKVSHTSISSSASKLCHYATFSLGLVRYMPPVMEKVKMVRIGGDSDDVSVMSAAVESYEPVRTSGRFRARNNPSNNPSNFRARNNPSNFRARNNPSNNPSLILKPDIICEIRPYPYIQREEIELEPIQDAEPEEEGKDGYLKLLAKETIARALTSIGNNSGRLLYEVFIENPIGLYNPEDPLAPLKVLGTDLWRALNREADNVWNITRVGLITAAGMVNPILRHGVEATLNLTAGLVSKIPFPSIFSEGLDASTETPLLGDGSIVLSSDTDLGYDPKLHATGFDPETISPVYRILEPGIYKRE